MLEDPVKSQVTRENGFEGDIGVPALPVALSASSPTAIGYFITDSKQPQQPKHQDIEPRQSFPFLEVGLPKALLHIWKANYHSIGGKDI